MNVLIADLIVHFKLFFLSYSWTVNSEVATLFFYC